MNVHYIPVHLQPFYQKCYKTQKGMCPNAEGAYEELLSLPMFHGMTDEEFKYVISTFEGAIRAHQK